MKKTISFVIRSTMDDGVFACHIENYGKLWINHGNSWRLPRQLLQKTMATFGENHSNVTTPDSPIMETWPWQVWLLAVRTMC